MLKMFYGLFAFLIFQALKILKASDVKPYVVFISPPSYDRIITLRRGKVDPFNPQPNGQMSVSVFNRFVRPSLHIRHNDIMA